MSVVVNLISADKLWVMCDGLVVDQNGKKVRGTQKKFELLTPQICVGYTGTFEFAMEAMRILKESTPISRLSSIEDVAARIIQISKEGHKVRPDRVCFLISGISKKGQFGSIGIKNDEIEKTLLPEKGKIEEIAYGPDEINGLSVNDFLKKADRTLPQDEYFRKVMTQFVIAASQLSPTINKTVFFEVVRRG